MKRALILALVLLALATFALQRSRRLRPEALEPLGAAVPAASRTDEAALESACAAMETARASLATESDVSAAPDAPAAFDAPDAPAAGALVRVEVLYVDSLRPVRGAGVRLGTPRVDARTDERGIAAFQLPVGTSLGSIRINAGEDGDPFVPYGREVDQILVAGANQLAVRVERGADLRGFVRDEATGHPIAGANVRYLGLGARPGITTREDGSFELLGLLAGPWNRPGGVEAEHPHYLKSERALDRADVGSNAPPFVVSMRRGILLAGRIVDSEHNPVPHVRVHLLCAGEHMADSDERGRFEFGGLVESEHATLSVATQALPEGAILASSRELGSLQADREDIEFEVPAGLVIQVFADRPDGLPLRMHQFAVCGFEEIFEGVVAPKDWDRPYREGIVARGSEVQLEVYATVYRDQDPDVFTFARTTVRAATASSAPLAVHVELVESGHFEIPTALPGVDEVWLDHSVLPPGALDLQLLDAASGSPIAMGRSVTIGSGDEFYRKQIGPEGWLRLRGARGNYEIHAQFEGGPREVLPIKIPLSGYAKTEWRVRTKP